MPKELSDWWRRKREEFFWTMLASAVIGALTAMLMLSVVLGFRVPDAASCAQCVLAMVVGIPIGTAISAMA